MSNRNSAEDAYPGYFLMEPVQPAVKSPANTAPPPATGANNPQEAARARYAHPQTISEFITDLHSKRFGWLFLVYVSLLIVLLVLWLGLMMGLLLKQDDRPQLHLPSAVSGLAGTTAAGNGDAVFAGGAERVRTSSKITILRNKLYDFRTFSAELSEPRTNLSIASRGSVVYLAGGTVGTSLSDRLDIYNLSNTGADVHFVSINTPRTCASVAATEQYVIIAGGYTSLSGSSLSGVTASYVVATPTGAPVTAGQVSSDGRALMAACSTLAFGFFAGGIFGNGTPAATVDIFEDSSGSWLPTTTFPSGIARHSLACAVNNDLVFFGGGITLDGSPTSVVDVYDAASRSWRTSKQWQLSSPRAMLAAIAWKQYVIFAGGANASDGSSASKTVDIFDMKTGQARVHQFYNARSLLAAASTENAALFAGGRDSSGRLLSSIEIWPIVSCTSMTRITLLAKLAAYDIAALIGLVAALIASILGIAYLAPSCCARDRSTATIFEFDCYLLIIAIVMVILEVIELMIALFAEPRSAAEYISHHFTLGAFLALEAWAISALVIVPKPEIRWHLAEWPVAMYVFWPLPAAVTALLLVLFGFLGVGYYFWDFAVDWWWGSASLVILIYLCVVCCFTRRLVLLPRQDRESVGPSWWYHSVRYFFWGLMASFVLHPTMELIGSFLLYFQQPVGFCITSVSSLLQHLIPLQVIVIVMFDRLYYESENSVA